MIGVKTHHDRVTTALELLTQGLSDYVETALRESYGSGWTQRAVEGFRKGRDAALAADGRVRWDAQALLTILWNEWNRLFRHRLGHAERSLVSELREFRNRWAHQRSFEFDDAYRMLDSAERLLRPISQSAAEDVAREKHEMLQEELIQEDAVTEGKRLSRQKRWMGLALYGSCAIILVLVTLRTYGLAESWYMAAMILISFGYFAWQMIAHKPLILDPYECQACGRVIYSDPCPYCIMMQSAGTEAEPDDEVLTPTKA